MKQLREILEQALRADTPADCLTQIHEALDLLVMVRHRICVTCGQKLRELEYEQDGPLTVKLCGTGAGKYWNALPNVHWGISCSTQADVDRMAPVLLQIPAAVRWLSLEPLLENIDLRKYLRGITLCIVGCESGPRRRPCDLAWVRSIARQTKEAGGLLYVKQLDINGKVVVDPKKFPSELRWREIPLNFCSCYELTGRYHRNIADFLAQLNAEGKTTKEKK